MMNNRLNIVQRTLKMEKYLDTDQTESESFMVH